MCFRLRLLNFHLNLLLVQFKKLESKKLAFKEILFEPYEMHFEYLQLMNLLTQSIHILKICVAFGILTCKKEK